MKNLPPFTLPAEHFAAGLTWLSIGAVGLVLVAPELAHGAYLAPHVIAVTHCFTLGWITTSIFGALYQLFPVTLGVPARSIRVAHGTFGCLTAGVAALVAGAWNWNAPLLAAGWGLLFLAVAGIAWNLLPQRRRAPRGQRIGWYVSGAHIALGTALLVAGVPIGTALGWWPAAASGVVSAHAHLAAVGFATMTVVGVGSRLFPNFLLARGHPEWPLRIIGPLAGVGLIGLTVGKLGRLPVVAVVGGGLIAAAMILYVMLATMTFRHRARRKLGPELAHVAAAFVFLFLATAAGVGLLVTGNASPPRLRAAYAVLGLLGWLSLLVVGMYYRIVPLLTWMHRFSERVGEPGLPRVTDLTRSALAWASLWLLGAGVALLAGGISLGSQDIARLGAWSFGAGVAVVVNQHLRVARFGR